MDKRISGLINGGIGVTIFSGSLPATRVAVEAFDPVFLTLARAAIGGCIAGLILWCLRQRRPTGSDGVSLLVIAAGVVIGFPLLSALALQQVSSAHAVVFMGLLPLLTALFGVWRGGERPAKAFWGFSLLGSAVVMGFAWLQGGQGSARGDGLMLLGIVACGMGYAEGARLARRLGSWQVICWVLVCALPLTLPLALWLQPDDLALAGWPAWLGLGYVSLFSMLIGFFFWYGGLAQGGIALVGQVQLLQPFLGFALAALFLQEAVTPMMLGAALAVLLCVAGARRVASP